MGSVGKLKIKEVLFVCGVYSLYPSTYLKNILEMLYQNIMSNFFWEGWHNLHFVRLKCILIKRDACCVFEVPADE